MKKLLILLALCQAAAIAQTTLQMPKIFSSNMVLQRDITIPVWGKAEPGAAVAVTLAGQTTTVAAQANGGWQARLPQLAAGGPHTMTVTAGAATLIFSNVKIGDVWIASGQSNMEMAVKSADNAEAEIAAANFPDIRLFTVPKNVSGYPKDDVTGGEWLECSPTTVENFSAVAYYFGRDLFKEKNVPIGLVHTSWGGTPAEAWTSAEMLNSMPEYKSEAQRLLLERPDYELIYETERPLEGVFWNMHSTAKEGVKMGVHQRGFKDDGWKKIMLPDVVEKNGLPDYNGLIWFRKHITLPKEAAEKDLILNLGKIQQWNRAYFNGHELGEWFKSEAPTVYKIPRAFIRAGDNVIAVRVTNLWGEGGFFSPADSMVLQADGAAASRLSIAGEWRFDETIEPALPKLTGFSGRPAALYNAMIAPLIPYGIKGAIWYQGEANAGRAHQYRTLFPKMIEDWRVRWGQGYFPFLFVQLANFTEKLPQPVESDWAELREAQTMTLDYPNTGMAVSIDIGEADDIHPRNKQDVGKRLALAARKIADSEMIVFSGPIYRSMQIVDGKVVITFDHVGSGLTVKGDQLTGFAIAGADKKFVWADAQIVGDQVVVSSPKVGNPAAVRYAWANNPACNLYNKEGLPASPFRTDDWPGITGW